MMMSDLPADLLEEILSRVPVTCLIRLRSTCKRWKALFKDKSFTEKHLRNASKQQPRVLMLKEDRFVPTSVDLNVVPPSIEFEDALDLKYYDSSEQVLIQQVFHCDGLLLCTTKKGEVVVWNPCSGETRWIKQKYGVRWFFRGSELALGYENNQSCRSYKILLFWEGRVDGFVEIYDFNSNAWRVVNAPNCIRFKFHGVNLKGNAYWEAFDEKHACYLLSFDFTRERFKRLCFPLTSHDCRYRALSVVREELSVFPCVQDSTKIEVWFTNKIDTTCEADDLSWSKSFEVDCGFHIYNGLLINEDTKVALCCKSYFGEDRNVVCTVGEEDKYYTEMALEEKYFIHLHIFSYVPSLVQIAIE